MNHKSENRAEKLKKEDDDSEHYLNNEYYDGNYSEFEDIVKSIGKHLVLLFINRIKINKVF